MIDLSILLRYDTAASRLNRFALVSNVVDPRPEHAVAELEEHHPDEARKLKRALSGAPQCPECGEDPNDPRHAQCRSPGYSRYMLGVIEARRDARRRGRRNRG